MIPSMQLRRPTVQMQRETPIRLSVALLLCASLGQPSLMAQVHTAPHKKPSAAAPPAPQVEAVSSPQPPPTPRTPSELPPQRAEVTYLHGQLAVQADNASLNQILREISRETGIKITGGVAEERVFGKYGPSPASEVLASLLDGTSSNLLLIQSDANSPGELILTPRHGGVTPPNPNAPGFDDDTATGDDAPQPQPQPALPPQPVSRFPPPPPSTVPMSNGIAPSTSQPDSTAPAPAANATDTTDPNAVKTPQQIFEQLQQLRQQSQPQPQPK
jgi:hypothetical protein